MATVSLIKRRYNHQSTNIKLNTKFIKMLVRIVRMTFQENKLAQFHSIFDNSKRHIRAFPGNQHLELLRDPDQPNVRITYSLWESADALEAYRQSELFRQTWTATKLLFADRAQAFSAEQLEVIN